MELDFSKMGGVIIEEKETDYLAGTIPYEFVCEDFTPYLPLGERQHGVYMDAMHCVTAASIEWLETILNFRLAQGEFSEKQAKELIDLGYVINGRFELSRRFTAKMSGTTIKGNSYQRVLDSMRHDGILPEKDWTWNQDQRTPVFDWDDYYAEIPQALKDKAKVIFNYIDQDSFLYEPVLQNNVLPLAEEELVFLRKEMKQSPLLIASPVCNWNKKPCTPCGKYASQHATLWYNIITNLNILDTYIPYQKELSRDYIICYAYKAVIKVKQTNNNTMKIIGDKRDKKQYAQGADGKLHWLFSTAILESFHNSGVIDKNQIEWRDNLNGLVVGETYAVVI